MQQDNEIFHLVGKKEKATRLIESLKCPTCSNSHIEKPLNKMVGRCYVCGTLVSFFDPTPIQKRMIQDSASFVIGNFGGMGSGKTSAGADKVSNHVRMFPDASVAVFAQTLTQLHNIAKIELEKFFLDSEFKKKLKDYWELENGARINFFSSDSADKLRSGNFSFSWLIEASGIPQSVFEEVKRRTRNTVGAVYKRDLDGKILTKVDDAGIERPILSRSFNQILIESNPDDGWIRNELVLKAEKVFHTAKVRGMRYIETNINTNEGKRTTIYLSAAVDNPFVSETWLIDAYRGLSKDMIATYKYCDFSFGGRLVFPRYGEWLVTPFPIPQNWPIIMGLDPGTNEYDGLLWGTIDPEEQILYIIQESAEVFSDYTKTLKQIQSIEENEFNVTQSNQKRILFRVIDYAASTKSKTDARSGTDILYELGRLDFVPSNKKINEGINLISTYGEMGKLKIFNNLANLKREFSTYHWAPPKEGAMMKRTPALNQTDHLMDVLRYIVMNTYLKNDLVYSKIGNTYNANRQGDWEQFYYNYIIPNDFSNSKNQSKKAGMFALNLEYYDDDF